MSVFLPVFLPTYLYIYLWSNIYLHLSGCLSIYTSICLSFYLSIYLSIYQPVCIKVSKLNHLTKYFKMSRSYFRYTDQLCWINNTYYLSFNESIPDIDEDRRFIGYYQWTSIILAAMAVSFYVPRGIWMTLNKKSGIEVTTITGK